MSEFISDSERIEHLEKQIARLIKNQDALAATSNGMFLFQTMLNSDHLTMLGFMAKSPILGTPEDRQNCRDMASSMQSHWDQVEASVRQSIPPATPPDETPPAA